MSEALVVTNVVSLTRDPVPGSEVVSQAILGTSVTTQSTEGAYTRVTTEDRYAGWVLSEHLTPDWDRSEFLRTSIATLIADVHTTDDPRSELVTKLVVSTPVMLAHKSEIDGFVPLLLPDRTIGYTHRVNLNVTHAPESSETDLLDRKSRKSLDIDALKRRVLQAVGSQSVQAAQQMIGTPYLWGGCTPFGIDCSGLVQLAYRLNGLQLLRDADLQFHDRRFGPIETGISFDNAVLDPGDLVVFGDLATGKATHIGLATGDGRFIHALGGFGVRMDSCDTQKFVEKYLGSVRILADADLSVDAA